MKFQRIVIGLIAVILTVNVVGLGLIIAEEKKQTELEYISARLSAYNIFATLGPDNKNAEIIEGYTQDWEGMLINNYDDLTRMLHDYYVEKYNVKE